MGESILQLRQIRKSFDNTEVLKGIDLEVAQGEFITLLGASGCGKTTTLRIIAGLELPDAGQLHAHNGIVQSQVHGFSRSFLFMKFSISG